MKHHVSGCPLGFTFRASLLILSLVTTLACNSPPSPVAQAPTPAPTSTPAPPAAPPTPAAPSATPWVPPTALVGTPIPGAEATLTAAPALKRGLLTITNSRGERIDMTVEIADTDQARGLGLMFRSSMAPDEGMLFDFGGETTSGFWMANTILPLSIAFITADGTIIDIKDMQPLDTTIINASGPYHYALETNQGFFRVHGIAPGDRVTLPGAGSSALPNLPLCPR